MNYMMTLMLAALSLTVMVTACGKKDEGGAGTTAAPAAVSQASCTTAGYAWSTSYGCLPIGNCAQIAGPGTASYNGQCVPAMPYNQYGGQYGGQYPGQYGQQGLCPVNYVPAQNMCCPSGTVVPNPQCIPMNQQYGGGGQYGGQFPPYGGGGYQQPYNSYQYGQPLYYNIPRPYIYFYYKAF